jgi:hypothetical protein
MQTRKGGLPERVGSSCAEQVPPTMSVVPATHQCCVESGCLADFKTKGCDCHACDGTACSHEGRGGLPERVGSSCAEQVPPTMSVVPATPSILR